MKFSELKIWITFIFIPWIGLNVNAQTIPVYEDESQPMKIRVENALSLMTLKEKIAMCTGNSKFKSAGIPRLGIPGLIYTDGTHGVREENLPHAWGSEGLRDDSSTCMPCGLALASTWNTAMAYEYGRVLGSEARYRRKNILLGPGLNIQRTPLGGRNFEYFGEDPFLASKIAVDYIKGVQSFGVGCCAKHYFANNQETNRNTVNVEMNDRAMYEIYLPAFKASVQDAGVMAVMGSYNKFRGTHCCHNDLTINQILKTQFGFEGIMISDWDGVRSTLEAAQNGLDVEMGTEVKRYEDYYLADAFLKGLKDKTINEKFLDEKVKRILRAVFIVNKSGLPWGEFSSPAHQSYSRQVAEESIVLLKNEKSFLPLDKNTLKSVAVIGENASERLISLGGSSYIKTPYEITPIEALKKYLGPDVIINSAKGYSSSDTAETEKLLNEAVEAAKNSEIVLYFGGLNHKLFQDAEGADRKDMKLPYGQDELLNRIVQANPRTVVAIYSGGGVEMDPWLPKTPAVLAAWYPGMEGGNAITRILFGEVSPSGKLVCTFPEKLSDSPAHASNDPNMFPGVNGTVQYDEGILVGYRYFDTRNIEPLFCFGHGLSYTRFSYSDLKLSSLLISPGDELIVSLQIKNTGKREGAEVIQLYVSDKACMVLRPNQELKGFNKVFLKPGETKEVVLKLNKDAFAYYDEVKKEWAVEPGKFRISIGASSRDIRLSAEVDVK